MWIGANNILEMIIRKDSHSGGKGKITELFGSPKSNRNQNHSGVDMRNSPENVVMDLMME
jgi:hypothetical protein